MPACCPPSDLLKLKFFWSEEGSSNVCASSSPPEDEAPAEPAAGDLGGSAGDWEMDKLDLLP